MPMQTILNDALELPADERHELAVRILDSLDADTERLSREEWTAAWEAELQRRLDSLESGSAVLMPANVVMNRMRAIVDEEAG